MANWITNSVAGWAWRTQAFEAYRGSGGTRLPKAANIQCHRDQQALVRHRSRVLDRIRETQAEWVPRPVFAEDLEHPTSLAVEASNAKVLATGQKPVSYAIAM